MKTATLPAVRVAPEVRELVESVLKEGESLSTFIEETMKKQALWRKEDEAFYAEAARRSALLKAGKMKTITAEESIRRLRAQIEKKKAMQMKKAA
jgi:sigma54-dependent transcription regulator